MIKSTHLMVLLLQKYSSESENSSTSITLAPDFSALSHTTYIPLPFPKWHAHKQ